MFCSGPKFVYVLKIECSQENLKSRLLDHYLTTPQPRKIVALNFGCYFVEVVVAIIFGYFLIVNMPLTQSLVSAKLNYNRVVRDFSSGNQAVFTF